MKNLMMYLFLLILIIFSGCANNNENIFERNFQKEVSEFKLQEEYFYDYEFKYFKENFYFSMYKVDNVKFMLFDLNSETQINLLEIEETSQTNKTIFYCLFIGNEKECKLIKNDEELDSIKTFVRMFDFDQEILRLHKQIKNSDNIQIIYYGESKINEIECYNYSFQGLAKDLLSNSTIETNLKYIDEETIIISNYCFDKKTKIPIIYEVNFNETNLFKYQIFDSNISVNLDKTEYLVNQFFLVSISQISY